MFRVLSRETSKCTPAASTRTRKYRNGHEAGAIGPQTFPCKRWSFEGSSAGNFHREGRWISFPCAQAAHKPTLLASLGRTECPARMGSIRRNIVVPGCPIRPCHYPVLTGKVTVNAEPAGCVVLSPICGRLGSSAAPEALLERSRWYTTGALARLEISN
jgi:hypothetical protein